MVSDRELRRAWLVAGLVGSVLVSSSALSQTKAVAKANPSSASNAQSKSKVVAKPSPRTKLDSLPTAKKESRITMNFRDAPIDQILDFYSVVSGLTVIKDPGLQGTATLISPKPIPLSQGFVILDALLDSRGYSADRSKGMMKIAPKGRGDNRGGFGNGGGFGNAGGFARSTDQTQVFQLQYASAKSVAQIVNDLFKNNGSNAGNQGGNQGRGFPGFRGFPGGNNQGNNNANNADSGNAAQTPGRTASFARASSDDYSNSVVVTGPANQLTQISQMIDQIDQPKGATQITQIFPIQYIDATEMANVASNVLLASSNGGAAGGASSAIPSDRRAFMSARLGSTAVSNGQVVASAETNSIIVTASADQLDLIQKVVTQMDKPKKMQSTTYVRSMNNASATDIATLLASMFGNKTNTNNANYNNNNRTNSTNRNSYSSNSFGSNNSFGNNNRSGGSVLITP